MSEIRVRRHTDGRVALCFESDQYHWRIFKRSAVSDRMGFAGSELGPLGDGWSELLVAELPEDDSTWDLSAIGEFVAHREGHVDIGGILFEPERIRSDALKMLAAVATCEKYRAERETTT
jgi:hypothetical protein